jgi:hypothetical protein
MMWLACEGSTLIAMVGDGNGKTSHLWKLYRLRQSKKAIVQTPSFRPTGTMVMKMDCNPVRILVSCTGGVAMISLGLSFG